MIVWVTKSDSPEAGREGDMHPCVSRTKAAAVRAAKNCMRGDHNSDVCTEIVKVTFPEGNKDEFIRVLRWVMDDHDSGGHISNLTPGTILFKEIK